MFKLLEAVLNTDLEETARTRICISAVCRIGLVGKVKGTSINGKVLSNIIACAKVPKNITAVAKSIYIQTTANTGTKICLPWTLLKAYTKLVAIRQYIPSLQYITLRRIIFRLKLYVGIASIEAPVVIQLLIVGNFHTSALLIYEINRLSYSVNTLSIVYSIINLGHKEIYIQAAVRVKGMGVAQLCIIARFRVEVFITDIFSP